MQSKTVLRCAVIVMVALSGLGASAARRIRVVATTPDLAAIAREIGGTAVDVTALAKPTEDPHFVDAKPSHIVTLNRADVLIEGGAELELGWLPPLLENARNARIASGSRGRIVATDGVKSVYMKATDFWILPGVLQRALTAASSWGTSIAGS